MTVNTSQAYLLTRASVMAEQLLSESDLTDLISTPLEQLGSRFGMTGMVQQKLPRSSINRAAERALIHTLTHELSVLLRPLGGSARDLLVHWTRKFELYNLKALIRGKLQGLSYEQIKSNLHDLPPLISLPHEQLLRTENISELLRKLEQTPYRDIARQARLVFEEKNEPFSLDATIDLRYYTGLIKRSRNTEKEDHADLMPLIGTLVDQQNLPWLLRYRFNYGLSATQTYYLLAPSGRHLQADQLKLLVNMESMEQVILSLPESLSGQLAVDAGAMEVELLMQKETERHARRCLQFSQSAVSRSLAYLVLREIDLKRVYAIVQGRILGLDDRIIMQAADIEQEETHV